jgi:hypothetical protein
MTHLWTHEMYVCMYVFYVWMYVFLCMYLYVFMYVFLCMYVRISIYVFLCTYFYVRISMYVCISMYVGKYVCMYVRTYLCMYRKYSTDSLDRTSYFNYPTSCGRMRKEAKPVQVKPNAAPNVAEHNKTYTARKGLGLLTALPIRAHIASNQLHNNPPYLAQCQWL